MHSMNSVDMKIVTQSVKLVWSTPDPCYVIEMAARKCYASEYAYNALEAHNFIRRIIVHDSVLEHASACFDITTDRGVLAELTRHRLASYTVQSTRYCNYSNDKFGNQITVVRPPNMNSNQCKCWTDAMHCAETAYMHMIELGMTPQFARSVLPMCLATELRMTANFREWRHIIELRTAKAAHPQIRELVGMIQHILVADHPNVFGDMNLFTG